MTAMKTAIALAALALTQILHAEDQNPVQKTAEYVSAQEELSRAEKQLKSAVAEALSFDIAKALSPPEDFSREQRHEAFINALVIVQGLAHDANMYLKTSARLKDDRLAPSTAKVKTVPSDTEKVGSVAAVAVDYANSVISFADALKAGQTGEAQFKRVPEARKRLAECAGTLKW